MVRSNAILEERAKSGKETEKEIIAPSLQRLKESRNIETGL